MRKLIFALGQAPGMGAFASQSTTPQAIDMSNFQPLMIVRYIASAYAAYMAYKGFVQILQNLSAYNAAIKQQDDTSKQTALDGIFGGAIQFFATTVLAILGITI